jgi:hypothetical protein
MQLGDTGSRPVSVSKCEESAESRPPGAGEARFEMLRSASGPTGGHPAVPEALGLGLTDTNHQKARDDEAPLLQNLRISPATSLQQWGIGREKVSQEDMGWFPQDTSPTVGIIEMSLRRMVCYTETRQTTNPLHRCSSCRGRRLPGGCLMRSPDEVLDRLVLGRVRQRRGK